MVGDVGSLLTVPWCYLEVIMLLFYPVNIQVSYQSLLFCGGWPFQGPTGTLIGANNV